MQQLQATLFNQAFQLVDSGNNEAAAKILNRIQLIQRQVDDFERTKGMSKAQAEVAVLQALGMPVQMPQMPQPAPQAAPPGVPPQPGAPPMAPPRKKFNPATGMLE
jgi:hypothetical protein